MREIPRPPLLLITDRKLVGERLLEVVEESLVAGCKWVMIREKDLPVGELEKLIKQFIRLAEKYSAKLVLNGYPELVVKHNLYGVHLPWGFSIREVRAIVGEERLVGVSTHSVEEAIKAEKEGADYITLSPIFKSISKKDYDRTLGLETLGYVAKRVSVPVIALGGITPENAGECVKHGAKGVAVIGTVLLSRNPRQTVKLLLEKILNES